jgi:hypothetical protein
MSIERIPSDILGLIFGFIDRVDDTINLLCVCKTWNKLVDPHDPKWKPRCIKMWDKKIVPLNTWNNPKFNLELIKKESGR